MELVNQPTAQATRRGSRFWDKIADRYAKKPVANEAVYQKKLEISRQYLAPHMTVLELGCGTGSTAIAHAPFVKYIRAIDISSRMVEIARAKVGNISNITFEQLASEDLELPDNSLDAVLGLSLLHLLYDKQATINDVYRLLKPGGVFITSTACIGDMMILLKYVLPIGGWLGVIPKLDIFSTPELEQSFRNSGFEIEHKWQPGKGQSVFMILKKPT
jgi:ubiquinone/menaquinone biosynthesis C-methylase UbiE